MFINHVNHFINQNVVIYSTSSTGNVILPEPLRKRKHVTLTLKEKLAVIADIDQNESLENVSKKFKIAKSTVINISKKREVIREKENEFRENGVEGRRTVKTAKFVDVEQAVFLWIMQERSKKHVITPDTVKAKAELLFEMLKRNRNYNSDTIFTASNGWYDRFRKRYGLKMLTVTGERASGDTEAFTAFKNRFMQIILANEYEKCEINNANESFLFI